MKVSRGDATRLLNAVLSRYRDDRRVEHVLFAGDMTDYTQGWGVKVYLRSNFDLEELRNELEALAMSWEIPITLEVTKAVKVRLDDGSDRLIVGPYAEEVIGLMAKIRRYDVARRAHAWAAVREEFPDPNSGLMEQIRLVYAWLLGNAAGKPLQMNN